MPLRSSFDVRYLDTLILLKDALRTLDELNEGIAAAHLCTVIDIVSQSIGHDSGSHH